MADIKFYAGENFNIHSVGGSGIGFYGSGFGNSVAVGSFQDLTFITDSTGTVEGPQVDNNKYLNSSGVGINGGSEQHLLELPNYLATLNVRFNHSSAVKTQNVKLYGSQRGNKNLSPSGLTLMAADIIHPDTSQTFSGSGDAAWVQLQGSGQVLDLVSSPGTSGLRPNGQNTSDTRHDWYIALSAKPTSAGAKEFQCVLELEFL